MLRCDGSREKRLVFRQLARVLIGTLFIMGGGGGKNAKIIGSSAIEKRGRNYRDRQLSLCIRISILARDSSQSRRSLSAGKKRFDPVTYNTSLTLVPCYDVILEAVDSRKIDPDGEEQIGRKETVKGETRLIAMRR